MRKKNMAFDDIHCIMFDLDDTLYAYHNGLWEMIGMRINQYMIDELHFPAEEVPTLRNRLWEQYGTTLRGLQVEFSVDMDAYLSYVHDVPIETILKPDPELNRLLHDLPQRKVIFTNADKAHAQRTLNSLCIAHHFITIIDIHAMAPFCKPQVEAFHKALGVLDEHPEYCLLVDDNPKNLATAQALGMATVSVGAHPHDGSPHIARIHELGELFRC